MKLEVGMYVRTIKGIGRIEEITEDKTEIYFNCDTGLSISFIKKDFTQEEMAEFYKHSHNIIDLIEVGDVITFKNDEDVYRVSCIPNKESACDCFYLVFNYATQYGAEDIEVSKEIMQNTLESVIMREQFEKIAYKVGDDK